MTIQELEAKQEAINILIEKNQDREEVLLNKRGDELLFYKRGEIMEILKMRAKINYRLVRYSNSLTMQINKKINKKINKRDLNDVVITLDSAIKQLKILIKN